MLDLNGNYLSINKQQKKDDYVQETPKQSFLKEVKKKQGREENSTINNLSQVLANAQKTPAKEENPMESILGSLKEVDADLTDIENQFAALINSNGEVQISEFEALLEKLKVIEARLKQIDEELSKLSRDDKSNDKASKKLAESMTQANVLRKQMDSFADSVAPVVAPEVSVISEPKAV